MGEQPTFAKQMKLYSEMKQKSKRSVSNHEPQANKKFFAPAIFQKCWRGVGEQPTFAKQIWFWNQVFQLQLHVLKLSNSNKVVSWESRLQIRTRQRGNCSMLVGKSRGGTPFCRMRKIGFPKRSSSRETIWIRFGRIASLSACVLFAGGCVVQITYESFLDFCFSEFFMFLE